MSLNGPRLNELVHDLAPAEAAEIREFASRPSDEQLVWLYREMKRYHTSERSWKDRLTEAGTFGALIAYILFDHRAELPRP